MISPLHSHSGSSTTEDTSFWETELSEELCETHQHTESDNDTCDLKENISGPIDDEMGIVASVQS